MISCWAVPERRSRSDIRHMHGIGQWASSVYICLRHSLKMAVSSAPYMSWIYASWARSCTSAVSWIRASQYSPGDALSISHGLFSSSSLALYGARCSRQGCCHRWLMPASSLLTRLVLCFPLFLEILGMSSFLVPFRLILVYVASSSTCPLNCSFSLLPAAE